VPAQVQNRGHRLAAYRQCSADQEGVLMTSALRAGLIGFAVVVALAASDSVGGRVGRRGVEAPSTGRCQWAYAAVWDEEHSIETDWATWVGDVRIAGCVDDIYHVAAADRAHLQSAFERVFRDRDLQLILANSDPRLRAEIAAEVNGAVGRALVRDWSVRMSRGDIWAE